MSILTYVQTAGFMLSSGHTSSSVHARPPQEGNDLFCFSIPHLVALRHGGLYSVRKDGGDGGPSV